MLENSSHPATLILLALSIAVSGYALAVDRNLNNQLDLDVGRILGRGEWYRMVTSGFVHGDLMHLLFNMYTLYAFGPIVETILGTWPFVVLYFGSELAANALTLVLKRWQRGYASLGASGAICGVLLSFCVFEPFARIGIIFLPIQIPAFIFAICYIGYSTFQVRSDVRDGTAHEAHLGGALAGIAFTLLFRPDALQVLFAHFNGG